MPPALSNLPQLDDRVQEEIAKNVLPKFLKYRLDHLRVVRESRSAGGNVESPTAELVRTIVDCVPKGSELMQGVVTLLQTQEEDYLQWRSFDPALAVIEVLWTKLQGPEGEIGVGRLAELTNALLRSRGASHSYSAEELGWKLKKLGIPRDKDRASMVIRFSRETSQRVHERAQAFGLNLPTHQKSCADCARRQASNE